MNVKFKRTVSVDFDNTRTAVIDDKTFSRGQVVQDVEVEKLSRNFSNLHFINGDLAISVPNDAFDVC